MKAQTLCSPEPQPPLDAFGVMQSAVRLARDEQIGSVERLKRRLLEVYPGEEKLVDQAIDLWSEALQKRGRPQ